jgi:glycosyltransferase involved in cell wall biosynthesis
MRIAILNLLYSPLQIGGAEKAVKLLAEALVERGHEVSVISLHPEKHSVVETLNGVRVYRLPMPNIYWPFREGKRPSPGLRLLWQLRDVWNWSAAKRVGTILDEIRPEVVHTNILSGFSISVWKEIKKRGVRVVHTLHDYYLPCFRPGMFRNGRPCANQCFDCKAVGFARRSWSNRIDAVVSVSDAVLATHRRFGYFIHTPGYVVFNIQEQLGGRGERVTRPNPPRTDKDLTFGFIGALTERKGIGQLLEATRLLSATGWRLRIAGTGQPEYIADLKSRFTDPRIQWLGFKSADDFYPSVDVVVIPSIWQDPLPYVALETYAFRKGLICSRSGGLPELARLGKQVATYDALDTEALAQIMDSAIANPNEWRDGGFADTASKDKVTKESIVGQYLKVYRQ